MAEYNYMLAPAYNTRFHIMSGKIVPTYVIVFLICKLCHSGIEMIR